MLRTGKWITLILWGLPLLAAASFGQTPAHHPNIELLRQPIARRGVAMPALPSGPLPQVPMDQLPSTPPQVSYQGGMLTIVAQNSSLGDILREVHKRTGAAIEVPLNATERVATRLGPGPARDVLASLLNGSAFNYVMVGSESDPASVASITLTTRSAGGAGETVTNAYQPPQQYTPPERAQMAPGMGPGGPVVQPPANDDEADAEDADAEENADQDQAATAQDGSQPPNGGPKTPEQILEMLRQHQPVPPNQVRPNPQIPPPNQQPPDNE
ncbi:MAG TPA: hypothetical protein VF953_02790 [Terriglobales bacterium]